MPNRCALTTSLPLCPFMVKFTADIKACKDSLIIRCCHVRLFWCNVIEKLSLIAVCLKKPTLESAVQQTVSF